MFLEVHNSAPSSDWNILSKTETMPKKSWSHVGVVRDNNDIRVYLNGTLINSTTLQNSGSAFANKKYTGLTPIFNRTLSNGSNNSLHYVDDLVFIDNQVVWSGNSIAPSAMSR